MATTEYGTWWLATHSTSAVEDDVTEFLGDYVADYDVPGLVSAYRDAVNEALPDDVALCGDLFFGPYPAPRDAHEQIAEAVRSVDLSALAEQFDNTRED
jgi:hypothetical protein